MRLQLAACGEECVALHQYTAFLCCKGWYLQSMCLRKGQNLGAGNEPTHLLSEESLSAQVAGGGSAGPRSLLFFQLVGRLHGLLGTPMPPTHGAQSGVCPRNKKSGGSLE